MTTVSLGVMDSMDSPASQVLLEMASEAPQGTQVPRAYLEPRVFQERWAPQDWAYQAQRASVDSLEMLGYLDHQASPVLLAPREPQDSQIVTQMSKGPLEVTDKRPSSQVVSEAPKDCLAGQDPQDPQVPKASEGSQASQELMEHQDSRAFLEIQAGRGSQDPQGSWDPEDPKVL